MEKQFIKLASAAAKLAGKPWTFLACVGIVLVWALSGPVFRFSETWQLVINTGTTVITFLMVFLIQNTQNRDGAAMQAKLDELLFAVKAAENRFIGIEHLTERELDLILREVETRALEVQSGQPARPLRRHTADAPQPKAAPAPRARKKNA